jgi:predicted ATP-grasp superfamily ATP-dependent carboligase
VIQTKIDARDGRLKLVEVNPRFGNNARIVIRMLVKQGINLPLLWAQGVTREGLAAPIGVAQGAVFCLLSKTCWPAWCFLARSSEEIPGCAIHRTIHSQGSFRCFSHASGHVRNPVVDDYVVALASDPRAMFGYFANVLYSLRGYRGEKSGLIPWGDVGC